MPNNLSTSEAREITRNVVGFVVTEMGDEWAVDTDPELDGHAGVYVDGPDGARLFFRLDWKNAERLEISGSYPRNFVYQLGHHAISVSRFRDPESIARDVARRLLPDYFIDLARVDADNAERADNRHARLALAERWARQIGTTPSRETDDASNSQVTGYIGGISAGTVRASLRIGYRADRVDVELSSLTPEQVQAVLDLLT